MKLRMSCIIMLLIFGVSGCLSKSKKEEISVTPTHNYIKLSEGIMDDEKNVRPFEKFYQAPITETKKALDEVTKVYMTFPGNGVGKVISIALDIPKKEYYSNIDISNVDGATPDAKLSEEDIKQFMDILKEEKVQDWKESYDKENNPKEIDVFIWSLSLENADGTKERHGGIAQEEKDCTPQNFNETIEKIMSLKCIVDNKDKKPRHKEED